MMTSPSRSTSTEEALWRAAREDPASAYFNLPIAFRLEGPLDPDALERSLNGVVRRHGALRTIFEEREGRVVKRIVPELTVRLARQTLAPGPGRDAALAALLATEADTAFDLAHGPLLRAGLVALSAREHVLVLTIHHAIFDQWSGAVFFQEWSALHDAEASGRPSALDPAPAQMADCSREFAEWLKSAEHDRQLQYWTGQLRQPLCITEMPSRRAQPLGPDAGAVYWFELAAPLAGRMTAVARARRITPFMLLLATFAILLHRYTGDEDISVASALARRRKLAWQGVVGLLMNGVMLRTRVRATDTCEAIVRRVRDAALQAYDNQDVPHSEVRRAVGAPSSHEARARQVSFHSAPRVLPAFAGVRATFVPTATSCAKSDFGLSLFDETRDGEVRWHGEVEYNAGIFERSDIIRIVGDFERLLTNVCDDPERTVADATAAIPVERAASRTRGGAEK